MFIMLTASAVKQKWIVNSNAISFVCPSHDNVEKTMIYLIGDNVPIEVDESFSKIEELLSEAMYQGRKRTINMIGGYNI